MQKLWNKLEINLIYELDLHQFLELEKKIERLVKIIVFCGWPEHRHYLLQNSDREARRLGSLTRLSVLMSLFLANFAVAAGGIYLHNLQDLALS